MPQLDPSSFPPQLIWLAITFVVMYLIMSRVALPRVGQVLDERQARISDNLDKAAAFKGEAEDAARQYEEAIAKSRQEAQTVIRETSEAASAEAATRTEALAEELSVKVDEAERRIAEARAAAIENVREVAVEVAADIAKQLAGVDAGDDAGTAVDAALKEVR